MKKKETIEITVNEFCLDGTSKAIKDGVKFSVKHGIPGQKVAMYIKKLRQNRGEGKIVEILEHSPLETESICEHFDVCGGCSLLPIAYEKQLELKRDALSDWFVKKGHEEFQEIEVIGSPDSREYKNKMEFTFGNEHKDGQLTLGMHMTNRSNSIVFVEDCRIVDEDYRQILQATISYFRKHNLPFYHIMRREGYLRHLVLRKGKNTGDILVNLVTTTQLDFDLEEYCSLLLDLSLDGRIMGVLHTENDSFSDAVIPEKINCLYGTELFEDKVLGMNFKISPFSFFQTNTKGAEVLYSKVREMVKKVLEHRQEETIFDLYSGTGTIGILVSTIAKKVIAIELIEEAVEMAKENAKMNGVENVEFIAGDVAKEVGKREEKPYLIILDPPRSGMHPKAIGDVLNFEAENIIYISCNPKIFAEELHLFKEKGYQVMDKVGIDQFPNTNHCETVALLSKLDIEM